MKSTLAKIGLSILLILSFSFHDACAQNDTAKKMYQHVLLFNWADSIDQNTRAEVIQLFKGLPDKIDGFEKIDIYDVTKSTENFDNVMVLQFRSKEALRTYEEHPDHIQISKIGPPLLDGFEEVNYWK